MLRFSVITVILLSLFASTAAFAGKPAPSCSATIWGLIDPISGKSMGSSSATGMYDTAFVQPFDTTNYRDDQSHVALWSWNGQPSDLPGRMNTVGLPIPYFGDVWEFHFWAGLNATATTTLIDLHIEDAVPDHKWESALYNGGNLIWEQTAARNGYQGTLSLDTQYMKRDLANWSDSPYVLYVTASAVPEPSAFLVLGSGFISLVGFGIRRRH